MEHMALRARSPQALERRVAALKGSGFDIGWVDGDMGQGPAFRCRDPDGHIVELYYETEWYQAPSELKPALKNRRSGFRRVASMSGGSITSIASPSTSRRTVSSSKTIWACAPPNRSCSTTARKPRCG